MQRNLCNLPLPVHTWSAFPLMKIVSAKLAPHPHSVTGREKCVVTLHVSLAGPQESMQIAVVVPNENDENAIRECGIARAKDFARQFANLSPE